MKKILLLLVLIINILTICACVPKDAYISGDDYIDVECSSLYKLENYDKDDITWSSSNENVLTIINGMVIAHDAGEAYIYAKVKNKVFEKKVIVTFPNISITINGRSSLYIDEEAVFTYDLSISLEKEVTWSSSDESILTIDNKGNVIALSEGSAYVTASIYDSSQTFLVNVSKYVFDGDLIGPNEIKVGQKIKYDKYSLKGEYDFSLFVSDESIATIDQDGTLTALKRGSVTIFAERENGEIYTLKTITILERDFDIVIKGDNKLNVGDKTTLLVTTNPSDIETDFIFTSSNPDILGVSSNGVVTALKEGSGYITVTSTIDSKYTNKIYIEVEKLITDNIEITGNNVLNSGEYANFELDITGDISSHVTWEVEDKSIIAVYKGIVLGLKPGKTTLKVTSNENKNIYDEIEITVNKYIGETVSQNDLDYVNNIISKMTLSQKVGQMFVVGFSGTSMPSSLKSAITDYNFGNVIYMGANCTSPSTLAQMSNDIQNKMVSSNLVPAFISTDQEGGRVARLTNGGTHFVSQMTLAATNNPLNAYYEGVSIAEELLSYGINVDYAPVLDVNNNPDNPIIGIRSYADNPVLASLYGTNVLKGFEKVGLIGSPKHFPGHGNTSVDSHYGLPKITSSLDELYKIELAPFISAINSGVDMIMTTHIIFSAIDEKYPATLSEKVLQGLLRDTLGYDGVIITDGMGMDAIDENYGSADVTSVLAIKAGVDILLYTGLSDPKIAHNAIIKAVNNNEITEERINESVRRILLAKLKYGILDNYITENIDRTSMLNEHEELNLSFAKQAVTKVYGEFCGLDKTKKTLIISPTTSYSLGDNLESNSFANYAANYLKAKGHNNVSFKTVSTNISSSDSSNILNQLSNYEQIVVAFSNVKTSNYSRTATFVKELCNKHSNVIVIALDTPYDILSYGNNVENYICIYGYQKVTTIALAMYLNGEFAATGVSPVEFIIGEL